MISCGLLSLWTMLKVACAVERKRIEEKLRFKIFAQSSVSHEITTNCRSFVCLLPTTTMASSLAFNNISYSTPMYPTVFWTAHVLYSAYFIYLPHLEGFCTLLPVACHLSTSSSQTFNSIADWTAALHWEERMCLRSLWVSALLVRYRSGNEVERGDMQIQ